MTALLVIVSLYGGLLGQPMSDYTACLAAAKQVNDEPVRPTARAYCLKLGEAAAPTYERRRYRRSTRVAQ